MTQTRLELGITDEYLIASIISIVSNNQTDVTASEKLVFSHQVH
jgi:hypothetical protein